MVRRRLACSGWLIFVVLLTSWAAAQLPNATDTTSTPAPGDHDYLQSLVETVNPANGSVSIRISVPMAPSRQITLPFSFAYDTNGAFYIGQPKVGGGPVYETTPTISPFSQGGWNYAYPAMSLFGGTWQIPNNDSNYTCHGSFNYVFQDSRGGRHNLGLSVSPMFRLASSIAMKGFSRMESTLQVAKVPSWQQPQYQPRILPPFLPWQSRTGMEQCTTSLARILGYTGPLFSPAL
jgi:hypothetical protein